MNKLMLKTLLTDHFLEKPSSIWPDNFSTFRRQIIYVLPWFINGPISPNNSLEIYICSQTIHKKRSKRRSSLN